MLVFAAGGDLHREPSFDEPAVHELARDLYTPERCDALLAESTRLASLDDPDYAWRAFALGLLADALGEE